jgi:hypothetical protein
VTLMLDSYGKVDANGAAIDPDSYDYRRAARDAIHFPTLVDRFWQNTRRCVGWDVQYFGTVEPQKRGAPHFHTAIRGTIPRAELRAITAATYHQVWWPPHDELVYTKQRPPVWDTRFKAFTDPDTGVPLPTFAQACQALTEPAHVVRFGPQVHVKGILGGTEEAGRHIGYLTKYLTKSISQAAGLGEQATEAHREHAAGCTLNCSLRRVRRAVRSGCCTGSNRTVLGIRQRPGGARAKPTDLNTSASPGAAFWCRASGPTKPWTITARSTAHLFGNCWSRPASNPPTAPTAGHTYGNAPHPQIPTSHRGPSC